MDQDGFIGAGSERGVAEVAWPAVIRALREARGVTQQGWAAQLGVSRRTVQRWERGEILPDPIAETAIIVFCEARGLFRSYDRGHLAGITLTAGWLRDLLADARLANARPGALESAFSERADTFKLRPLPLPAQLTSFVGREKDVAGAVELLATRRLVTLTGPGGVGKTRLALAVAEQVQPSFPDGVWFVDCSPLTEPGLVLPTIASRLGVRETEGQALADALLSFLRDQRLLLLLDNFEHLIEAAPSLVDLLRAGAGVRMLVTSREHLRLGSEQVVLVPPLPLPERDRPSSLTNLSANPAIRLFLDRARGRRLDFGLTDETAPAVAEICARLDGLPLAIELVATRIDVIGPAQMLEHLNRRLPLLDDGPRDLPDRQRTLHRTMQWSWDLLAPDEQMLCRRLAVFAGSCSLAAAVEVTDVGGEFDTLTLLESLVAKSLLRTHQGPDGEPRLSMLRVVHDFAHEQLVDSGEQARFQRRHAGWVSTLTDTFFRRFTANDVRGAITQLQSEVDNVRAALGWCLAQADARQAVAWIADVAWFWYARAQFAEGREWAERCLNHPSLANDAPGRARLLSVAGSFALQQGDIHAAVLGVDTAITAARAAGDREALAAALHQSAFVRWTFDPATARLHATESVERSRAANDAWNLSLALTHLGAACGAMGDLQQDIACLNESLTVARAHGMAWAEAIALLSGVMPRLLMGDHETAERHAEEALGHYEAVGDLHNTIVALIFLAFACLERGETRRAADLARTALRATERAPALARTAWALEVVAIASSQMNAPAQAARLWGAATRLRELCKQPRTVMPPSARPVEPTLKARLGEDGFVAAHAAGHTLSLGTAIALAMEQATALSVQPSDQMELA